MPYESLVQGAIANRLPKTEQDYRAANALGNKESVAHSVSGMQERYRRKLNWWPWSVVETGRSLW